MVSWDETIAPGKEGKIKVHIDTSEYEGNISKSIIVETDDPDIDMSEFTLTIYANVISPIKVSPRNVYFIGGKKAILKSEVTIKSNFDRPLVIKPVSFDLENKVQYRIKEIKEKKLYKITFIKFPSEDTELNGTLKIKTNYPEIPYIHIRIKGYFYYE